MGYFIAYRHTGADPKRLKELLPAVKDAFEKRGHETYCTFFNEKEFQVKQYSAKQILQHAFERIDLLGNLFVIIDGDEKSEGMLVEIGYCKAKQIPIVVAKRKGASGYADQLADKSFEYSSVEELTTKMTEVI